MTTSVPQTDETRVAELIVSVLPEDSVVRVCCDDREIIRFAVRSSSLKLRTIVLSRSSLKRLALDPAGAVKIDYLRRDLYNQARSAYDFHYPRLSRMEVAAAKTERMALSAGRC